MSMGFDDPMPSPFTSSGIVLGGVGFSVTGSEGGVDGALGSAEAEGCASGESLESVS